MKYIDEQTQAQLLDMNEVILEVEKALQAFSENKTITPLRYVLPFNEQNRYLV
ncbi:ornithine cyclodeaminase, partial [Staphylococcus epidermidis]